MKRFAAAALPAQPGAFAVHAQQRPASVTFSGAVGRSVVSLRQPGANDSEDQTAGSGTLGQLTFRHIRAVRNAPQPSNTCPGKIFFASVSGAGVLRFQGGSLLKVGLLDAGDCVETMAVPPRAQCTVNFIVMGGTGRFQGASGTITLTEAVVPVLAGAAGNPAHFATTGTFTISGAAADEKAPEGR